MPRTGILPRGQNGPHCNLSPAAELEELRIRILRDLCVHGWSCTAFGQTGFRAQPTQQALDLAAAIGESAVGVPNERTERAQTAGH